MKLCICIPTYNRAGLLARAVQSVYAQTEPGLDFQVLISDNHSSDETPLVVEDLRKRYQSIRYIRNAENRGVDGNLECLIKNAEGDYIVFLMDDDMHLAGTLHRINEALIATNASFCALNHFSFEGDVPEAPIWIAQKAQDFEFDQGAQLLKHFDLRFASSLVIRRDLALEYLAEALEIAKVAPHNLHLILANLVAMRTTGRFLFLGTVAVAAYTNPVVGYDMIEHGYLNSLLLFRELHSRKCIDSRLYSRLRKRIIFEVAEFALKKKFSSTRFPPDFSALRDALDGSALFVALVIPITMLPAAALRPFNSVARAIWRLVTGMRARRGVRRHREAALQSKNSAQTNLDA